jgi:flagellar basal body L-ring protein FlgH
MTTPAAPTLSLSTDKTAYNPGDTLTLTASYSDASISQVQLTITATATDAAGNTVQATTTVPVNESTPAAMTVEVSDSFNDSYTQVSNDNAGTAVFTATVTPPAA